MQGGGPHDAAKSCALSLEAAGQHRSSDPMIVLLVAATESLQEHFSAQFTQGVETLYLNDKKHKTQKGFPSSVLGIWCLLLFACEHDRCSSEMFPSDGGEDGVDKVKDSGNMGKHLKNTHTQNIWRH